MSTESQPSTLPRTGIAPFCRVSYVFEPAAMHADVAILGVPFDNSASMWPGRCQAPRALRDVSGRNGWFGHNSKSLAGIGFVDGGDANVRLDETVTRERMGLGSGEFVSARWISKKLILST